MEIELGWFTIGPRIMPISVMKQITGQPMARNSEETNQGRLERVYRAEGKRLWRALWAYSRDPHIASDSLSEAFAQALRRGPEIRQPSSWIWRTSFMIAAGEMKRKADQVASLPPEEPYEMGESDYDVVGALGSLSPMQRGALILHAYGGYSSKEIAAALGSTSQPVRVHLSRAKKRLRKMLEAEDEA